MAAVLCIFAGTAVFAQSVGGATVQTNSAVNISNYQAVLNGYLSIPYISGSNYVYFQWGTTTGYGFQTPQQYQASSGSFNQTISGLTYNTTYHFRAVAQGSYGTIYGQDLTFTTSGTNPNPVVTIVPTPPTYIAPQVLGASSVSTGLTNNFLTNSFSNSREP